MILYDSGGRTIIFTETKNDASELAGLLPNVSRALHGDIAQAQREVINLYNLFLPFQVTLLWFSSKKPFFSGHSFWFSFWKVFSACGNRCGCPWSRH